MLKLQRNQFSLLINLKRKTIFKFQISQKQWNSVQLLSCVQLFATPRITACQASLSITNSRNPPKPMSIESVMPSISSSVVPFSSCPQSCLYPYFHKGGKWGSEQTNDKLWVTKPAAYKFETEIQHSTYWFEIYGNLKCEPKLLLQRESFHIMQWLFSCYNSHCF